MDDEEISDIDIDFDRFVMLLHEEFPEYSPKELADYFRTGQMYGNGDNDTQSLENKRAIVRIYLRQATPKFQQEFRRCLDDELDDISFI